MKDIIWSSKPIFLKNDEWGSSLVNPIIGYTERITIAEYIKSITEIYFSYDVVCFN